MKKWITKALLAVAGLGVLAFFAGCYPDNTLTVKQSDVVMTGYNDSVNFQGLHTYYMPDTILIRRSDTTDKTPVQYQKAYLAEIASQMKAMGFQRLTVKDTTKAPDVELVVSDLERTYVAGGWYYPGYSGWGYPAWGYPGWGWGWGWGWYYPASYYFPFPWYSEYKTGTLLMEMINPKDYDIVRGDTVARVYWSGAMNGLLEGNNIESRVLAGIDQAFKQSPELKHSSFNPSK